ncbi:M24 family metallopeptidase [Undibacterium sp.]|uniref:M24 family metallopeptidase n=1 Tax=Undibacterium sp. TaxID=1914977 RepID=UPI00374CE0B4
MPTELQITEHRKVQLAAKTVLDALAPRITPEDTEQSIAAKAHAMLREAGYPDTWYYDCPALVLLGSRSCVSVSGRDYSPCEETVGSFNLITVDLSPIHREYWGDCARSFVMENGKVTAAPQSLEFKNGLKFLHQMHSQMPAVVRPHTTFGQLFDWTNMRIRQGGFVNLDYRNNVGHSIATNREGRQYIQANNDVRLGDVPFFSYEPFIRLKGGKWGFKHEGIFFFNQAGALEEL